MIRRHLLFGRKAIRNLDSVLKSRDITLPAKVHLVKAVFFSQHSCTDVRFGPQRKLSAEELMLSKCVLKMTCESSLNSKQIKPVDAEGNQPWIFIERADSEAEAPALRPPDVKSWLTGKDSDAGMIEGRIRRVWQKMRQLDSITNSVDTDLSKLLGIMGNSGTWHAEVHGVTKVWT